METNHFEDIENAANELSVNNDRVNHGNHVNFKKVKGVEKNVRKEVVSPSEEEKESYLLPGHQKVWVKTYGCSHNISDSEYMEGLLTQYGYELVPESKDADVWLVNSCTVKDPSQAAFMNVVEKAKSISKPIIVAGCVSQADRNLTGLEGVSILGISQIDRVVEAVEQTVQGNTIRLLAKKDLPKLDLPKVRKNPLIEIIPLSTGCLGSCTYCKTKQARGKLGSYALEAIVDRAKQVIEEGVSEIWLSSEDTGAYGRDIGTNIVELLQSLIAVLPSQGGVMLRVGMTNPPYILEHLEKIADILKHPSVYSFLHIPVQAGSNKVLTGMNREYSIEEFRTIVDYLHLHVPQVTVATDIICGFPNEDDSDFQETLDVIQHYKFAIVNISQFYPRPGTPAAKMKRIKTQIVKDRSRQLTKIFEAFHPYGDYMNTTVQVYFDIENSENPTTKELQSVGHTKSYVKVLVPYREDLPGSSWTVKIQGIHRFHIEGELEEPVYPSNYLTSLKSNSNKNKNNNNNGNRKRAVNQLNHDEQHHNLPELKAFEDKEFLERDGDIVDPEEQLQRLQQGLIMFTVAGIMWFTAQYLSYKRK
jgi:threonylcarbamoyladenosine tRNA methylthiotransferase CDKAL1